MPQGGMHKIMTGFACSLQTLCLISLRIPDPIESMMIWNSDYVGGKKNVWHITVGGPKIHFSTLIQDKYQISLSPFGSCSHFLFPCSTFFLFPCYSRLRLYNQLIDLLPQFLPLSFFSPMDFWSGKPTCCAVQAAEPSVNPTLILLLWQSLKHCYHSSQGWTNAN